MGYVAVQQRVAPRIFLEQAQHLGHERWVVAALRLEECSLGGSRQVRYFMEEGLDPFPARGIHPGASARSPQLMRQPCLGGSPVAENGGLRYAEQLGAFRHVEAAEEPALNHQRLARLKAGELLQRGG